MATPNEIKVLARVICRIVTRDDCIMDTDPDRAQCHKGNCRLFKIAADALKQAKSK